MSRLDNIIARNNQRPSEKVLVTLVLTGIVLVLLVLAVFTDLGTPPVPVRAQSTAAGSGSGALGGGSGVSEPSGPPPPARHVHGVLLRSPASRPAAAAR